MLLVLMLGTEVLIHRHSNGSEDVALICGKMTVVVYDNGGNKIERILLDASVCNFECVVPAGMWYTVGVFEPSVLYEVKNGKYGEDGTESFGQYQMKKSCSISQIPFPNLLGGLKKNIKYFIGMERQVGLISPLYVLAC